MATTYQLKIVSPEAVFFEAQIESLVAPGVVGSLGVLANHAPLLTSLAKGNIVVRETAQKEHVFEVNGGVLEVSGNVAVILADEIKRGEH